MRYSKVLKLGAVGLALLLIPRRSSRQSDRQVVNDTDRKPVSKSQSEKHRTDQHRTEKHKN